MLITTKRGTAGRPKISVNAYMGYDQAQKKLEMMNGDQWIAQATEVINAQYVAAYGAWVQLPMTIRRHDLPKWALLILIIY